MITTKKGAEGNLKIDISSGFTADQAFYLPKLQYRYGQSAEGSEESWGEKGSFQDPVGGFFETGTTFINTVALSGGTNKMQNYFSYGNTSNTGILPTNTFKQHSLTFRNSTNFFDNKLNFDGSLMYAKQDVHNRPTSGLWFNQLAGVYLFPRGLDFDKYKTYEYHSPTQATWVPKIGGISMRMPAFTGTHHSQTPIGYCTATRWIRHAITSSDKPNCATASTIGFP